MNPLEPVEITCPNCWETYEILLDTTAGGQTLTQDCEVCCNPMEIDYAIEGGNLSLTDVRDIGQ